LASVQVIVLGELVHGDSARLSFKFLTIARALGISKPKIRSLRLEFNSAELVGCGESPFNLDTVVGNLGDNGSLGGSPVRISVLVGVNGDRGDKNVSSSEVAIAVHDV